MTDRQQHIMYLGLILDKMYPPKPYKAALIAARNTLIALETEEQAGLRSPYDWPYCPVCGKPYKGLPTDSATVRDIVPDCDCQAYEPGFAGRPDNDEWEYTGQGVTDWEQIAKAGAVEMVR